MEAESEAGAIGRAPFEQQFSFTNYEYMYMHLLNYEPNAGRGSFLEATSKFGFPVENAPGK